MIWIFVIKFNFIVIFKWAGRVAVPKCCGPAEWRHKREIRWLLISIVWPLKRLMLPFMANNNNLPMRKGGENEWKKKHRQRNGKVNVTPINSVFRNNIIHIIRRRCRHKAHNNRTFRNIAYHFGWEAAKTEKWLQKPFNFPLIMDNNATARHSTIIL